MAERPFVVTVASEKGGVGKTTLATNLAVYLKALREDLPVTIASFDNHFSVDQMFAIGRRQGRSVVGLFRGEPLDELVQLGEYGVQFLASERRLDPSAESGRADRLARLLETSRLGGILILDTRPILDFFTESALVAADLVLVPVKDRASLVNAASLRRVLEEGGDPGRLWLVPSLVDARLRLREGIGVADFLAFAGRERGYQVTATYLSKSPKVEGLATNLTSRVYPVLTHARTTQVHRQLRELAGFVLERFDGGGPGSRLPAGDLLPGGRRLLRECPVCGEGWDGSAPGFFQDLRSRRRGLLHDSCWRALTGAEPEAGTQGACWLAVESLGPGLDGGRVRQTVHRFDGEGGLLESRPGGRVEPVMERFLAAATGRSEGEYLREVQLLLRPATGVRALLEGEGRRELARLRKRILREVFGPLR